MKKPTNAQLWPKLHWDLCGFVCACLPVLAAMLVRAGVLQTSAAVVATVVAVIFVIVLTWRHTRQP
ncbi:hypothetical protein ACVNIS_24895 (plasmid) [Sphaerotilaceae bacterium SBD11-9]